jgi:hypothetical protein
VFRRHPGKNGREGRIGGNLRIEAVDEPRHRLRASHPFIKCGNGLGHAGIVAWVRPRKREDFKPDLSLVDTA